MKALFDKIKNLIRFGRVTNIDKDDQAIHTSQFQYFDKTKNIPIVYPYGFSANAPLDTLAIIMNVGHEENAIAIPFTSDPRPKGLKKNEVAIGNFVVGSIIKFHQNGDIEITAQGKIIINGNTQINGNLDVSGTIKGTPGVDLVTHIHNVPAVPGPSGPPQ